MKKYLLLLLFAALLMPWTAKAQTDHIVAEGTTTSSYVPIYGFYVDAYLRCQVIYTEEMLADAGLTPGSTITSLVYYLNSTPDDDWGTTIQIKMGAATSSTFSGTSWMGTTGCTTVYTGNADITGSLLTFALSTPYTYMGGNLLVEVNNITKGDYSSASFYGITSSGLCLQGYDYDFWSDITGTQRNFIPKTNFIATSVAATCPKPTNLAVSDLTENSATLSWTAGGEETSWELTFNGVATIVNTTTYALTGLNASTDYTAKVRAICGAGDTSYATLKAFRTPCGTVALPYDENFNSCTTGSTGTFPNCWTKTQTYNSSYPYISSTGNTSNSIYMNATSTSPVMVSSPMLAVNANQAVVAFDSKWSTANAGYVLTIGVISDPNDASTFVPAYTLTGAENGTAWMAHEYDLSAVADLAASTAKYIAFKFAPSSSSSTSCYIDNVHFEQSSNCKKPINAAVATVTNTGAAITWELSGLGDPVANVLVQYKADADADWTEVNTTETHLFLSGLTEGTHYTVRLSSVCATETSGYVELSFVTKTCGEIAGGTTEVSYVPMYSTYNYGYSQSIYTADDMVGLDTITGISFEVSGTISRSNTFDIYLGNTTASSVSTSNFVPSTSLTKVVNNKTHTFTMGWNTITFDTPFVWDGASNVVVAFDNNTGSWSTGLKCLHHAANGGSCYWYRDGSDITPADPANGEPSNGDLNTRPNIRFVGNCSSSDCEAPLATIGTVTSTSIEVSWAPLAGATWMAQYKAATDNSWTTADDNITAASYTFTGLNSATHYSLRIGTMCADDTAYTALNTVTECGVLNVPFSEDFNQQETSQAPMCWTAVQGSPIVSTSGHSGKGVYFYASSTNPAILATPEFAINANQCVLEFEGKFATSNSPAFSVGVLTDPTDPTSYVEAISFPANINANTWTPYYVDLSMVAALNGSTAKYIAFKWAKATGSDITSSIAAYIDSVVIYQASDCKRPVSGSVTNIAAHSATVTWQAADLATEYQVAYGTSASINNAIDTLSVTGTTAELTGLVPETQYSVWVRTLCGAEETPWLRIDDFTTLVACEPVAALVTANETSTSVTLGWNSANDNFEVKYRRAGTSEWTAVTSTTTVANLTGLQPASNYEVEVRSICGTDTSRVATITFTTACGTITITQTEPFVENFNTYTNVGTYNSSTTMPNCWGSYDNGTSSMYHYGPHVVSGGDSYWYSPDNSPSLGMTAGEATYGTPKIAVLPEFTNALNTLQMYFWMRTESSSSGTLDVGYVTSDDYVGTFTSIQTIPASNRTYSGTEYEVYLDQVPATATNLAFRWTYNSSYYSVCLDNITVSIGSDCRAVSNPTVMSTTPTSATLSWTGCDAATGYQIIYGTSNNIANVTTDTVEAATTTSTITGLATETTYYAWVRSICNGETTRWVAAGSFTTDVACAPVENIRVLNGTFTSATIGWDINANVGYASTEVEFSYKPATASTWTTDYTTNNYYFLTGLTEGTSYNVRILNICSDDTAAASTFTFMTGTCGEIGDGSTTVSYVPFYGLYNYGYTQTIYPASEVGAVDTIFGISYNVASTSTRSRTIDVYLGNTQMTSLSTSNYVATSDLTLVASNKTLNPSTTGWKTIMFDTPFVYDGSSNLVVAVDNNTGSYNSFSFKGHTATTGNAVYWYQDGSNIDPTSPSASNSSTTTTVPDIRLSVNCGAVTCPAPLVALGSVNQHDATLVWNAGGTETEWTVEYKLTTETEWTTAVANTTATTYTINGLNAGQYYNFRVGALCSGETSYGSVSGFTQCDVFTVPYYENFDASTELNPCWKAGNTGSTTNIPYINSGSLYGTYTAGGWVILPEFDQPINSLQLSFISEYTSSSTPQIAIGVVSDPANINSMTVLQTLNIAQGEEEQIVYFDGYTGTGNIAIKFLTSYIYIDDLAVEVAPSCHKVTGVHVTATTNNSATLEWNSHTAANYEIRYKTADGAWQSTVVHSNPATVTGLQDASDYVFQVRAICTVGDSSVWSLETTTQTLCNPIVITAEQSHLESFEGSSLPICWEATSTSTTYKWDNITNSYSGNGMYFRDYNGYNGTLISPLFDCSSLNNGAQLRFWYQNPLGDDDVPVTLDVMYRTDGGEWQTIGTAAITTAHADWTEAEVVLPNSQNAANYQIALKATSTTYYEYCYLYLDEFMVEARPTCTRPTDLTLVTAGATTATISWTSDAAAATVQYRRANTSNWTTVQATGNSVTLSGLSQSTTYEVQVSANCSETDQSPYSNIYTFNTNCYDNAIATFPWVEGFENGIMCWQQQTITGNDLWVTQTGDGDGSYHQIDRAYSGSKNATFYSPSLTTNNSTRIISPALNITSLNNPYLKFAHAQTAYSGVNDKLMLYYRASASSNWVSLTSFTSAIANWTVDSIALPGASAEYQIAFVGTFMGGNGVIIDQVTVYNNSSAPGPNPPQGIEEAEGSMNLSIYPNPASGSTTITIDGVNGKLNVAVVDMNGRTVMSETVECNEGCTKQIDVENLAQGAYFVRVNGETISTVKKLIVR